MPLSLTARYLTPKFCRYTHSTLCVYLQTELKKFPKTFTVQLLLLLLPLNGECFLKTFFTSTVEIAVRLEPLEEESFRD